MVSVSKDEDGKVVGYIEWKQCGPSGFDKWYGEYVWINDFWIHKDFRGTHVFHDLWEKVLIMAKGAKYMYFTRAKYGKRPSKLYTREQIEKFVKKGELMWAEIQ